jgi:porphobilinogen synthase
VLVVLLALVSAIIYYPFSLNDLVLPIFVEEEIDDYKAIDAMPGVMRIPEKHLAREIERIANAGIRSVMTFGISHHTDATGSDAWKEDGLVARMSRICKETVPEMIVMSDTCFCEYTSHGHCGVLCDHGVDNDATLLNLGKQAVVAAAAGADFIAPSAAMDGQVQAIRQALDAAGFTDTAIMSYRRLFHLDYLYRANDDRRSGLFGIAHRRADGAVWPRPGSR